MVKYILSILLFMAICNSRALSSNTEAKEAVGVAVPKKQEKASRRVSVFGGYETADSISAFPIQSTPPVSLHQQFQWLNGATKPQILGSPWYGFNNFVQRSARNIALNTNRLRSAANLLGESTQMFPMINFPPNSHFPLDNNMIFHQSMNDLQGLGTVPHQDLFQQPRFHRLEQPKFPRPVLVPVIRPRPQQPVFEQHHRQPSYNYRRQASENIQRSSASPSPVTIKIVPLKLSSIDLSNALKSMSWIPISLDMLKVNPHQNKEDNQEESERPYGDRKQSMFDDEEDESDLPPPSSHVATPPLGITYAEGRRSERYVKRLQPRK
ncbi:hypothetical protein AVEN_31527-1 [Araneus ventricosus]|uniref:Uncharacterized protein n=1 Tax=Araneus ventricosus TaxID=182803 RepID=A0A4Y2JKC4_ARAVE|nr:hypothetical protein AVEN_31527-1 [Araneus ventricosus]